MKLFEPGVQEEMSLKDISYLELWQSLCSVKQDHLCNFGRRHHGPNSVKLFEFGPVVMEISFKRYFLSGARAAVLFSGDKPFV